MFGWISLLGAVLLACQGEVQTKFVQLAPRPANKLSFMRTPDQTRAVVLIHGLSPHPFSENNANRAACHCWQKADCTLVEALAKDSDVFAFAYSQNVPVDEIADDPSFMFNIWRLKQFGYREIVLVGASAGGVIARQFVEDYPDAGVTKVIQVCTPNAGSSLGRAAPAVRESQEVFVASLTKEARQRRLEERADRRIPTAVQFVCVVGTGAGVGDGVVASASQWSEDLQRQGIPAAPLCALHCVSLLTQSGATRIAELVREDLPRWSPAQVAAARKQLRF